MLHREVVKPVTASFGPHETHYDMRDADLSESESSTTPLRKRKSFIFTNDSEVIYEADVSDGQSWTVGFANSNCLFAETLFLHCGKLPDLFPDDGGFWCLLS